MTHEIDLRPGSRAPRDGREIDLLLRRVPEVALLPEFSESRFIVDQLPGEVADHRTVVARLADSAYLDGLRAALDRLKERAENEQNGALLFVATCLTHFIASLPPDRHPLVVALYFASVGSASSEAATPEALARCMDEYDSVG